ncbi:MAG: hypothetical protein LIO46_07235 [Clostridiales bacterium]|nr:hypothetical protein [Clostridiales bacterium]
MLNGLSFPAFFTSIIPAKTAPSTGNWQSLQIVQRTVAKALQTGRRVYNPSINPNQKTHQVRIEPAFRISETPWSPWFSQNRTRQDRQLLPILAFFFFILDRRAIHNAPRTQRL